MPWKHVPGLACLLSLACAEARPGPAAGSGGAGHDGANTGGAIAPPTPGDTAGTGSGAGGTSGDAAQPADAPRDAGSVAPAADASTPDPTPCAAAACDPEEATCSVAAGRASCTCVAGYRDVHGDGTLCEGVDECADGSASCADDATCINTPAGHACVCDPGFHGDGSTLCEPNLACAPDLSPTACGDSGYCRGLEGGSGVCACGTSEEGDGLSCSDLDECARGVHDCHGLATCSDDSYLYRCPCPAGYLGDGRGDSGCFLTASRPTEPRIPDVGAEPCPAFPEGTSTLPELLNARILVGPKAASPSAPLLFYWHATGSSAAEVTTRLPAAMLRDILGAGGMVVAFDGSTGTGGDCSGVTVFARDDFLVADQIVACAVRDHGIDPRRIYATGCSAGGLQAGCMAVRRSSYLAGVITNSGGLAFRETMQSAHAPATVTLYGASPSLVIDFGQTSRALTDQIEAFGGVAVECSHGQSHCAGPEALYLAAWELMKAHPFGTTPVPADQDLPVLLPEDCVRP